MLNSIRLLRGIAALLVVVYHVCEYLKTHGYPELADAFPFGAIGVDLFFAVSGFVMLHAMESKKFDAGFSSGFDFFVRRIIRVAPIYWIGTSALYGIYVAMPHKFKMFSASAEQYWRSMLFLPSVGEGSTIRPLLTQGWTLYHEMYFYLVLAMAIVVLGRRWAGSLPPRSP
jgi:exopolysaccharide production protein ExoZ